MKKTFSIIFFLLFTFFSFAADQARFMKYPDVYKDKIVFSYENDLWLVSASGGTASRITTAPGSENYAKFSPDGKQIAFTGSYDGTSGAYLMDAEGGTPERISYMPGAQTIGWHPDGQRVIVRSYLENFVGRDPNLFFINKNGSAPERFPIDRGRLCSFSADGSKMLYNRRGNEEYYWKRYKGGQYPDIWMYDFKTKAFEKISDYVGKNAYPMWIGNEMFFVSDRDPKGITNLYKQNLKTKEIVQLTHYTDVDVMFPSTDGDQIVFMHDGKITLYNVKSNAAKELTVVCPSDRWSLRTKYINPKEYIHSLDFSNDGKKAVIEARGDLFIVPAEKGETKNISNTPGTRERFPQLSPDGKKVAFFSDKTGNYQLYLQSAEGGEWTALTEDLDRTVYRLVWSPDGKKILFGNKDFAIFVIDAETKKMTAIDRSNQMKNDEFYWEIADYSWSPDSKWVTYSLVQYNRNSQIFIYNIEEGKRYPVTSDNFDNLNPAFDANGDYLYYLSSRNFDIQMDFYEDNHVIETPQTVMLVQLRNGEKPPFGDSPAEAKTEKNPMRIDVSNLQNRTYPLPVPAGNYFYLQAGKGKAAWCSIDKFSEEEYGEIFKPGRSAKWQLHLFDISEKKDTVLSGKIRDYHINGDGERMWIRKDGEIYYTTVEKAFKSKKAGELLSAKNMVYFVDYRQEWEQIFNDTWKWYRDFFYDKNMHGRDWTAMGKFYRSYIPYLSSREELNWVLSQMVGELCVSHTYIGGGDYGQQMNTASPMFTGLLGADLKPDKKSGYYQFEKIYGPTDWNLSLTGPLARPDIAVSEGDYLLAINGTELKYPYDYFKLLQTTTGQKASVTVNSKPTQQGSKTYEIELISRDQSIRYFRWLTDNINTVLKKTGGKVGYMHVNAMGSGGIGEFDKFWRAFRYKDGLIIDVRRNSGGWTEYFLIDKLERKMVAYNVLRDMEPFRYPGSTSIGNYVVISNENNGSDGEAFVEDFKANKLGTVVGVPSWGGLVGILNTQVTIDNGSVEQSNNAFYGKDGTWLVENHGADPDILIDNDPASVMAGRDPQLERAIEEALKKIAANPNPPVPKKVPAYPVK